VATKKNTNSAVNLKGILNTLEDTTEETNIKTDIDTNANTDTKINTNTTEDSNTNIDITENTNTNITNDTIKKFTLKKKLDDKKEKKAFNVYMQPELIKELDKLSKKSGYSRNELINLMCEYCVKNLELIEQ
jgi:hypothetical protein